MKTARTVLMLTVAVTVALPLFAAGEKRKAKQPPPCPAAQRVERWLEGMTLTDDQKTKLGEITKEFGPKLVEAIKKGDVLTPDQKRAQGEAMKAAKAAGKAGKEMKEAVDAAVKATDDQKAKLAEGRKEVGTLEKALREKVMAVLTPDQQEQLQKKAKEAKKKPAK